MLINVFRLTIHLVDLRNQRHFRRQNKVASVRTNREGRVSLHGAVYEPILDSGSFYRTLETESEKKNRTLKF